MIIQVRWKKSNSLFSRLPVFSPMLALQCPFFVFSLSLPRLFLINPFFCLNFWCALFFSYSIFIPDAHFLSFLFFLCVSFSTDPGAVVETHSAVPYAVIGGVLALLVFTVICVLIVTIWCSVRQKGNGRMYT